MSSRNFIMILLVTAAASLFAAPAVAQRAPESPLEEDLDNYWSTERDLPVVSGRIYEREGRFGLTLFSGLLSSQPYWWYIPVGGRISYNITDQIGIDVSGNYNLEQPTELQDFLEASLGAGFDPKTDLDDRFIWRANASFVWSPLYGKWSFANNKLGHFDANLVAGLGVVSVERPNLQRDEATTEIVPEGHFGIGIAFLFTENWSARLDGRFYLYQEAETESNEGDLRLAMPVEFQVGVSYLF